MLSITREDRGAYTCRAFSPQGEAIHTTRLLVQGRYMCIGTWKDFFDKEQCKQLIELGFFNEVFKKSINPGFHPA